MTKSEDKLTHEPHDRQMQRAKLNLVKEQVQKDLHKTKQRMNFHREEAVGTLSRAKRPDEAGPEREETGRCF